MNSQVLKRTMAQIQKELDQTYTMGLCVMIGDTSTAMATMFADVNKLSGRFVSTGAYGGRKLFVNIERKKKIVRQFPLFGGAIVQIVESEEESDLTRTTESVES